MDNNRVVPEVEFDDNALTFEDIVKQNQQLANNQNNSSDVTINDTDTSVTEQNTQYDLNTIDDFQIQDDNNFEDQIKENVQQHQTIAEEQSGAGEVTTNANNQTDDVTYSEEVLSAALDLIKEQGILNIPDDVEELTEEGLQQLIDLNNRQNIANAYNSIKARVADPRLSDLIDLALSGGTYEEALEVKEVINEQYDFASLNPEDPSDQTFLLEMYLSEGLNPEIPIDARRLEKIPEQIKDYVDNMEALTVAQEAKEYFINKLEQIKQIRYEQAIARKQEEDQYRYAQQQQQQRWIEDFKTTLNQRTWANSKKQDVIKQFDIVELDNGSEVELWRYKWNKIWENPELTHVLMDFLSDLDPYELQFKSRGDSTSKKVTSKIMSIINSKKTVSNKLKSDSRNKINQPDDNKTSINPATDW